MTKLNLTYFDLDGGRGEPGRLAFAIVEIRLWITAAPGDWARRKNDMAFTSVPVLEVDRRAPPDRIRQRNREPLKSEVDNLVWVHLLIIGSFGHRSRGVLHSPSFSNHVVERDDTWSLGNEHEEARDPSSMSRPCAGIDKYLDNKGHGQKGKSSEPRRKPDDQ